VDHPFLNRLTQRPIVLASKSPRRRQLLTALELDFVVDIAEVDETPREEESPEVLVCRLCRAKAAAVAERHPGDVVLAADTLVVLDGVLLGKPADPLEAVAMLSALRDRVHSVYTAVCVTRDTWAVARVAATDVKMRAYTDNEIEAYVETGDPLDKAGAYGIQDPQFAPVARWDGCYSAVMGLPMGLAVELLRGMGIGVETDVAAACSSLTGDHCCHCTDRLSARQHEPCLHL
jgi:MAF protein